MDRRLAAILLADVVGYSRLMAADDTGTLAALKERRRSILDPVLKSNGGRIVKFMGDGVLVEFASAVKAVEAAAELQDRFAKANEGLAEGRRILLRIGINLGDVIGDGSDIYGEGVNVAARLEALALPGGICVSAKVYEEIRGKVDLAFEDMGEQRLKNIDSPILAYRARRRAAPLPASAVQADRPSIAVLPFQNMSGDPAQEYFADGIVEEIITALSHLHWLSVTARNSSFIYKDRPVDVRQVGRDLGVRYVLEGSIRKAANRVRITGQLIDASLGVHLWADRFEGDLDDIFELQDRVTSRVVGAISPKLERAEIERALRKPTDNLDAYDYFLRGMACHHNWTGSGNQEALPLFLKAIELDDGFAAAYGMAARCYVQRKAMGLLDNQGDIAEADRLGRAAGILGKDDPGALWTGGFALAFVAGDLDTGDGYIETALDLNPNLSLAWAASAWVKDWLGMPEIAIERAARGMVLSPHDPLLFSLQASTALAHYLAGRYADALLWAEIVIRNRPSFFMGLSLIAASAALCGDFHRVEEARRRLDGFRASPAGHWPFRRKEDREHWSDGLRKAGLLE